MCILSLNEKQYLQQKEWYKDHAQNAQNFSTICLQNTYKQVAQSVKIICTRYRNQVQCFQIISYDLLLCEQNCTNGWELDDHRFQSKLVIIPFYFQPLPPNGRSDGQHLAKYSFDRFRTLFHSFVYLTGPQLMFHGLRYLGNNREIPEINDVVIRCEGS